MVMLRKRSGAPNPSGLGFCFYLTSREANATLQFQLYTFTTKSLPQNLKMSNRTQICDANVIPPAILIQNHYHQTQKWGNEPKSISHFGFSGNTPDRAISTHHPQKYFFKTQSKPILISPYPNDLHDFTGISARTQLGFSNIGEINVRLL